MIMKDCIERKQNITSSFDSDRLENMHDIKYIIKYYGLKAMIIENISQEHDMCKLLVRCGYAIGVVRWEKTHPLF